MLAIYVYETLLSKDGNLKYLNKCKDFLSLEEKTSNNRKTSFEQVLMSD